MLVLTVNMKCFEMKNGDSWRNKGNKLTVNMKCFEIFLSSHSAISSI